MTTRRRYGEEELSRVLGEHAAGQLVSGGHFGDANGWRGSGVFGSLDACGCANEVGFNEVKTAVFYTHMLNRGVSGWFDANYRPDMTPEELLHGIEAADVDPPKGGE